MYKVSKNRRYTILEKPNSNTPPELRALGRSKMGNFSEPVGCPWDDILNRYETGLNKHSREFRGKTEQQVKDILKEREDLITYLRELVEASGKTENQFLEDYLFEASHNKIVDTSSMDNYLRLFLAMRGSQITPESDKGNIGRYGTSMFMIRDTKEVFNAKEIFRSKKDKVKEWFYTTYKEDSDKVLNIMRFEGLLGYKQTKSKAILSDLLERRTDDIDVLDNLIFTIEKTSYEDIVLTNKVKDSIRAGVIRKEDNRYVYQGTILGTSVRSAVAFLKDVENIEISSKIIE